MVKEGRLLQGEVGLGNFGNSEFLGLSEGRQYFLPPFPLSSMGQTLLPLSLCLEKEHFNGIMPGACMAPHVTGPWY